MCRLSAAAPIAVLVCCSSGSISFCCKLVCLQVQLLLPAPSCQSARLGFLQRVQAQVQLYFAVCVIETLDGEDMSSAVYGKGCHMDHKRLLNALK